jgi:hypothetical protein
LTVTPLGFGVDEKLSVPVYPLTAASASVVPSIVLALALVLTAAVGDPVCAGELWPEQLATASAALTSATGAVMRAIRVRPVTVKYASSSRSGG